MIPYNNMTDPTLLRDVMEELERSSRKFGPFNSAHEGYAVLLEEVDELWDEVKKNPGVRLKSRMRQEAVQVAAMALRFMQDICCDPFKDDRRKTQRRNSVGRRGPHTDRGYADRRQSADLFASGRRVRLMDRRSP